MKDGGGELGRQHTYMQTHSNRKKAIKLRVHRHTTTDDPSDGTHTQTHIPVTHTPR